MAQTAVDWLVQELKSKGHALITSEGIFINVPNELIEQAEAMEIEHLEDCWIAAEQSKDSQTFFNYYKETYNK